MAVVEGKLHSSNEIVPLEATIEASENGLNLPNVPRVRLILLSISIASGLFLSFLDTTIVATALFTIGVDLKSLNAVTWVALSYTLSYLGCAVLFARLADIVGRKNAFISAFVIFCAFSLGCGFSQSINQLIACRTLQGVGGAGLYSLTFVILPELSPPDQTKWITTLAGGVVALSGVMGPLLGGIITHYTTWRWVFWINGPIGIFPLILFVLAWPKPNQIVRIHRRSWKELDVVGGFLLIAASVLVVFSFEEAGIRADVWKTAVFLATLLAGCLCWILLFSWEVFISKLWEDRVATMFPLRLLRQRVFMGYVLNTIFIGFPYFVVIFNLPIRLQIVNGKTQLAAGLGILPLIGSAGLGSALGGFLNGKKNRIFPTLIIAAATMVLGTGLLSTIPNAVSIPREMYGFEVFVGLGFGLTVSSVSMGAAMECEFRDNTVAQGIIAQMRILGGSVGIACCTAILGVTQRRELAGLVTVSQLEILDTSAKTMTAKQLHAVRKAYSDAFAEDLRVAAIVSAACMMITLITFRRNPKSFMEARSDQILNENRRQKERTEAKSGDSSIEGIPSTHNTS